MSIFERSPKPSAEVEQNDEAIDEAVAQKRGKALLGLKARIESAFKKSNTAETETEVEATETPEAETSSPAEGIGSKLKSYESTIGRNLDDAESTFALAEASKNLDNAALAELFKQNPQLKAQTFYCKAQLSRALIGQYNSGRHEGEDFAAEISNVTGNDPESQIFELCQKSSLSRNEKRLAAFKLNPENMSAYLDRFGLSPQEIQDIKEQHPKAFEAYALASRIRDFCTKNTEEYGPRALDGFGLTLLYGIHTKGLSAEDKAAFSDLMPFSDKIKVLQTIADSKNYKQTSTVYTDHGKIVENLQNITADQLNDKNTQDKVISAFVNHIARYPHNETRHKYDMSALQDIIKKWNVEIDFTDSRTLRDHQERKQHLQQDIEKLQNERDIKLDSTDYCLLAKLNTNIPPIPRGEFISDIIDSAPKDVADVIYKNWKETNQFSYDSLSDEQKQHAKQIVQETILDILKQRGLDQAPDSAVILALIKEKSKDNPALKAVSTDLTIRTLYSRDYHRNSIVEEIAGNIRQARRNEAETPRLSVDKQTEQLNQNQAETPELSSNNPEAQVFLQSLNPEQSKALSEWADLEHQKAELEKQKLEISQKRSEIQAKIAEIQAQTPEAPNQLEALEEPIQPKMPELDPMLSPEEKMAALEKYNQAYAEYQRAQLDYLDKKQQQIEAIANDPRKAHGATLAFQQTRLFSLNQRENDLFSKLIAINRRKKNLPEDTEALYLQFQELDK